MARASDLAGVLTVLINGAFVSAGVLDPDEATPLLRSSAQALLAAHGAVTT